MESLIMNETNWEPLIRDLAASLSTTSEHILEVYTKAMFTEGIAGLIFSGLAAILLLAAIVYFLKSTIKAKDEDELSDGFMAFLTLACLTFSFLIALTASYSSLLKVLNPEYEAIQEMSRLVK